MAIRGKVSGLQSSYGFIRSEEGEDLFFLPVSVLAPDAFGSLKMNQEVECERVPNPKDPSKFRAANVKIIR